MEIDIIISYPEWCKNILVHLMSLMQESIYTFNVTLLSYNGIVFSIYKVNNQIWPPNDIIITQM